jgi:hypothetical protein
MKAKEFFNVTTLDFNYSCVREYVEEEEMMGDPDRYNMKNFLRDVNKFENPIWEPGFYRNTPKEQWTDSQKKEYDEWQENRRKVFNGTSHTTCHTNCRFQHLKVGGEFDGEEIVILDIKKGVVVTKYDGYFYWYCVLNPNKKPSLYGDASADFARYLDY